jgi:hypothetical protein
MPQPRKSARSSSRASASYKEPAALKRLNRSLEGAQKALEELRSQAGRNAAGTTRSLHKGLGKFLSDARRDTGKFTTALKRDFESAQKAAKSATAAATGGRSTRRSTTSRGSSGAKASGTKASRTGTGASRGRASGSRSTRKSS